MDQHITSARWALGLWGVLSVIFGVMILAWPGITLASFLVILGVYLLASGVVLTIGSLISHEGHWIGGVLMGVLSAAAGLYVFAHPGISALAILSLIALWAIAVGSLQIVAGFEMANDRWWLILGGVIQVLFGFYIFANPRNGAIALVWLIGLSIIAQGLAVGVAAIKIHNVQRRLEAGS